MTDSSESPVDRFRAFLTEQKIAKGKIETIVAEFETYLPGDVRAVYPTNARGAVETVEVYGLSIDLDAIGRAARIALAGEGGSAGTTDGLDVEYWPE